MSEALATTLAPEERDRHYREALTYDAELRRAARRTGRAGWIFGAVGIALGVASLASALTLLPLKQTELRYVEVDRATGSMTDAVTVNGAPQLFSELTANQYLRAYAEACEGYHRETAAMMFHRCLIFSTQDQQERFAARVNAKNKESPFNVYGKIGSVELSNFRFSKIGEQGPTKVYLVKFDRAETLPGGSAIVRPWTMTVQFQWHPEAPMNRDDRTVNLAGFQVLAASSDPDGPDRK